MYAIMDILPADDGLGGNRCLQIDGLAFTVAAHLIGADDWYSLRISLPVSVPGYLVVSCNEYC